MSTKWYKDEDKDVIRPEVAYAIEDLMNSLTDDYLTFRLEEAIDTLKKLPFESMKNKLTAWPDYARQTVSDFGSVGVNVGVADPKAITRLDETLSWMMNINGIYRKVMWARASGVSYRKLALEFNRSHSAVRRVYCDGLSQLRAYILFEFIDEC